MNVDRSSNQALLYFEDDREGASDADHDARTEKVIELVNKSGLAFFTGTRYRGRSAMRLSASNWRLSRSDVEIVVAAVGKAIDLARADQGCVICEPCTHRSSPTRPAASL